MNPPMLINSVRDGASSPMSGSLITKSLLQLKVPVVLELGRVQVTIAELSELQDGSVLPLDRTLEEPLDVLVNGTPIARAEVVQVEGRFAIRITELLDQQAAEGVSA
jgi:flagellar motor switch protein FliN